MPPSSHVYFEGDWSPSERELVESATATAEAAGLPPSPEDNQIPWVATRQSVGDTQIFMAARYEGDSALMDRSAEGLAERIRQFAARKADDASDASPPLFQLVYESTETRPMSASDLQELLRVSRSNNEDLGVTGLLLYAGGQFLQVLEGPEPAVRDLYDTIQDDPRHTSVETLLTTSVSQRVFADWEMALDRPDAVPEADHVSSFLQTGELPAAAEPVTEVLDALERFRRNTAER